MAAALAAQATRFLSVTSARCSGQEGAAGPCEGTSPEPGPKPWSGSQEAWPALDGGSVDAFLRPAAGAAAAMLNQVRTQATQACLHSALARAEPLRQWITMK